MGAQSPTCAQMFHQLLLLCTRWHRFADVSGEQRRKMFHQLVSLMNARSFPPSEIMTPKEVEGLLQVSYATVRRLRLRGRLVAYRMGRRLYYRRSEVLAAITANPVSVDIENTHQAA